MLVQSLTMEEVYLVRHGETEWNLTGRRQGQLDSPLSERGMMEVQRTSKRIESLPVDGVFSSPLGRAISTAQTYAHALDQAVTALDDLRELDVMPSQVVDAADGGFAPEGGVTAVMIVEMQEDIEGLPALSF